MSMDSFTDFRWLNESQLTPPPRNSTPKPRCRNTEEWKREYGVLSDIPGKGPSSWQLTPAAAGLFISAVGNLSAMYPLNSTANYWNLDRLTSQAILRLRERLFIAMSEHGL